ncbi:DNA polymerase III subunit alpha, partial [candidate division KSB1 bacterium]|nr:DNA polymerase III subunit alpha [candidate division KSB1 bacterium]
CAAAKKLGMTYLALTDTNGLYGLVWFLQSAREHGLTPIIGAQLVKDSHHAVVLAKSMRGYQTLCRLITAVHGEESVELDSLLIEHHTDIIIFTDDLNLISALQRPGISAEMYVELIPHGNRESALSFARQHQLPIVASQAVYFVNPADWDVHRLLRAIDLNCTLQRIPPDELADPAAHFSSGEKMQQYFPDCPEAIENTYKIARACAFNLDFGKFIFPSFHGPNGEDAQSFLRSEVHKGILWRYGRIDDEIKKRLEFELALISEKGFAPYFLVVADAVRQAPRTCGRGSAASSLVSYCLGITHVDPLKYDLFFERFLNRGRKDPPDIDVDFPWDERDDILDYLFKKYGRNQVAMIANHNCFKARSALREIAKVYGLPDAEIGAVTKKISGYWQPEDLGKTVTSHPMFRHYDLREPWPEIIRMAEKIRGYPRHLSVHCGGVVIAPGGLDQYVPVQPAKKILNLKGVLQNGSQGLPQDLQTVQVVQWEKDQSEDMGLVKMDILGNRSLSVIRDAIAAVKSNYHRTIDFNRINVLEDSDTRSLLARGDTIGVFYVESPAMRQLQRKTGKGDFEHLVIHSSIIRPAANIYINEYIRRLRGGSYQPLHPKLEAILKETYGIMVYQEDVSKVAMALANFNSSEADELRKIIGKKHREKQTEEYRQKFFQGAQANGVSEDTCEKIWHMILSFSEYSFCKPHSASFALVSYQSAYLRIHYPAEFIAAVISNMGGYYSAFAYISEARRMGLEILPPDINESDYPYKGIDNKVRVGLMQLKGLAQTAASEILRIRRLNGSFQSFSDFLTRVTVDPSDITLLVKAGCFDALEAKASRPQLLWQLHLWKACHAKEKNIGETLSLFQTTPITENLPRPPEYSQKELWRMESEILGFLLSRHPLTLYEAKIARISHVKGCDLDKHVGEKVQTIGWLITHKLISTKDRQLMEFLSFEDTTAIYETVFFPKVYNKYAHMMSATKPYVLFGRVDEQYDAVNLNVEKVTFL